MVTERMSIPRTFGGQEAIDSKYKISRLYLKPVSGKLPLTGFCFDLKPRLVSSQ